MASTRAPLARFETAGGARIYRIPVETFPGHINNVYLILDRGTSTLVDVGSGLPQSVGDLHGGFEAVGAHFGERVRLDAVQHVVITHSHIDHFGYVGWFQAHTGAAIYIHELDARVLQNFEERIVLASRDLRIFLERSGLEPSAVEELTEMYRAGKSFFKSVRLDRKLRDGEAIVNGYVVHHVPGHCPGQICLQVDDVLFTADHVLPRITPHQSPAAITSFCGLELYLQSLEKVRRLGGIRVALPGHEEEIRDLRARIDAIAAHHRERLGRVLEICAVPRSLVEISRALFGERGGYTRLLALEEAGAHMEYLFQRGELGIANLDEVAAEPNPVVRYQARKGG
ncbi:MAG: MBL fold metallo-hydrolase [Candidatus Rokubacteria bacterium]|nr:MBL fold metallo-hydrolase [Candidatus Rokubacteria bacterium]